VVLTAESDFLAAVRLLAGKPIAQLLGVYRQAEGAIRDGRFDKSDLSGRILVSATRFVLLSNGVNVRPLAWPETARS
jgi:hypothetical protein